MCGFLVSTITKNLSSKKFATALELLDHRGPDNTDIVETEKLFFGFKRLAIQDLTDAGAQPMIDAFGNILCFNGEIYNFLELKEELENQGVEFFSRSDSEVLLKALHLWGVNSTLERLDGMFAACYFEAQTSKLFMFRDAFGMKPLFYFINGDQILVASEIKAILPFVKSIEINKLASFNPIFFTGMSPGEETLFDGIKSLTPGNCLEVDLNEKDYSINTFCDIRKFVNYEDFRENSLLSKYEIAEKFHSIFQDSVKTHLLSDASLAVLFSAGLDSSLVAAMVSRQQSGEKYLFKYQSEDLNDAHLARAMADKFDFNLKEVFRIDAELILKLPHLIYAYETLNKADGAPLSEVCSLAKKHDFKVMLTGDAADELWAGYNSFSAFRTHQFVNRKGAFSSLVGTLNRVFPGLSSIGNKSLHHLVTPFNEEFLCPLLDFGLFKFQREDEWQKCRDAYDFLKEEKEVNLNAFLLDETVSRLQRFMLRADRVGMANSIELRLPFLTKKMAKLSLNVPYQKKTRLAPSLKRRTLYWDKAPVRDVAVKVGVDKGIIYRPKVGTPTGALDNNNLIKVFSKFDLANVEEMLELNQGQIKTYVAAIKNPALIQRLAWTFLSMEIFLRLFIERMTPSEIESQISFSLKSA